MARIRSIKPEFWTSEQVVECSRDARLLFIGLWNFCEDGGVMKNSPKRIKMEVFPADDLDSTSIRRLLDELSTNGLIQFYEVNETSYIKVLGWSHQKIDKPNYKFPQPNGVIPRSKKEYDQINSEPTRRAFDERSPPEGSRCRGESKGREGSGVDGNGVDGSNVDVDESHSIWSWQPKKTTLDELTDRYRIPDLFITEQLSEFKIYWADREDHGGIYDAKFMTRVQSQWKSRGHNWKPGPDANHSGAVDIRSYGGFSTGDDGDSAEDAA